jgi:predicted SprT family Zn-dependent metalloprotease
MPGCLPPKSYHARRRLTGMQHFQQALNLDLNGKGERANSSSKGSSYSISFLTHFNEFKL